MVLTKKTNLGVAMTNELIQKRDELIKFNIAVAAILGTKSIPEICKEFDVVTSQVYEWKKQLEESGPKIFVDKRCSNNKDHETIKKLNATIEQITEERDFLARASKQLML